MRTSVEVLSGFLERYRIYPVCPVQGCNMQGSYTDHVTSTNGSHFKHLWQRTKLFKDGVPLERTRKNAWEQANIPGGAVRFNHLDWQVLMWRGTPPPPPVFDGDGPPPSPAFLAGAPQQLLAAGGGPPLGLWPAGARQGRAAQLTQLSRLPEEGLWYEVLPPISTPTTSADDWKSLEHVAGGWRVWKEMMEYPSSTLAQTLEMHGLTTYECELCGGSRGWQEHITGNIHYKKIVYDWLGDRPVAQVRHSLWQQWNLTCEGIQGAVQFNHMDGEIRILKGAAPSRTAIAAPPRVEQPRPPLGPPPAPATASAPRPREDTPREDHEFPGYHFQIGESKAEALIGGAWTRVLLKERTYLNESRAWKVEEFWGGTPHIIPMRKLFEWQESLPAYGFDPGTLVQLVDFHPARVRAMETLGSGTGTGATLARLIHRALDENGRKAWSIQLLAHGDQGQGERVVPLERLRLAPATRF